MLGDSLVITAVDLSDPPSAPGTVLSSSPSEPLPALVTRKNLSKNMKELDQEN